MDDLNLQRWVGRMQAGADNWGKQLLQLEIVNLLLAISSECSKVGLISESEAITISKVAKTIGVRAAVEGARAEGYEVST
jgi:hypothetical protein